MEEELIYIVSEINNTLALEHNLKSFQTLSESELLQVLIDVLAHFNVITRIDAKAIDRNESTRQILEAMKKIQYHPKMEISAPTVYRQSIDTGDKKVIYPMLRFILENKSTLKLVSPGRPDFPIELKTSSTHAKMIEELRTDIQSRRDRIGSTPQQIRPLRQEAHLNMEQTLLAQVKRIQHEIEETQRSFKQKEDEQQRVQSECDRIQNKAERLRNELKNKQDGELSVKEQLQKQIHEQEQLLNDLQIEQQEFVKNEPYRMQQKKMWAELEQLFAVKGKCIKEARAKGMGGTISIAKDSETFTLDNSE